MIKLTMGFYVKTLIMNNVQCTSNFTEYRITQYLLHPVLKDHFAGFMASLFPLPSLSS